MTAFIKTPFLTKLGGRIFFKLESENPTGSIKDRMVSSLLASLLSKGVINQDTTVVEASSGNTGIALAATCKKLKLKLIICMAKTVQTAKQDKIAAYGAEVRTFDNTVNSEAEIDAARELGAKDDFYFFNQFENTQQVTAYQENLGRELLADISRVDQPIENLVMGIGTGASLIGISLALNKVIAKLNIYGATPEAFPTQIEGLHPGHIRGDFKIWREKPKGLTINRVFFEDQPVLDRWKDLIEADYDVGLCTGALVYIAESLISTKGHCLIVASDSADRYQGLLK